MRHNLGTQQAQHLRLGRLRLIYFFLSFQRNSLKSILDVCGAEADTISRYEDTRGRTTRKEKKWVSHITILAVVAARRTDK